MSDEARDLRRRFIAQIPDGMARYHADPLFHAAIHHAAQTVWVACYGGDEHKQELADHLSPTEAPQRWVVGMDQGPETVEWAATNPQP